MGDRRARETADLPLFTPPLPSSGKGHPERANTHAAYARWRDRDPGGRTAFAFVEQLAVERQSDARISVNAIVELVRAKYRLEINNTYRAWIADDLVARHPVLRDRIERRRRRVRP